MPMLEIISNLAPHLTEVDDADVESKSRRAAEVMPTHRQSVMSCVVVEQKAPDVLALVLPGD